MTKNSLNSGLINGDPYKPIKLFLKVFVWILIIWLVLQFAYISLRGCDANLKIHKYIVDCDSISGLLMNFIENNQGNLPVSREELIEKGYLIVRFDQDTQKNEYYYILHIPNFYSERQTSDRSESHCEYFDDFQIRYGLKLEDIELRNGKLFEKGRERELFILYMDNSTLKPKCRDDSLRIYNKMKEIKAQQTVEKNSNEEERTDDIGSEKAKTNKP